MEKIIQISGKDFKIKSSAYTPFAYKNETGKDLLKDINCVNNLYGEISKLSDENEANSRWLDGTSDILEMILKMAYIMIKEADKSIPTYEDWLRSLEDLMTDTSWMLTVLEVGMSPFSRQLQKN